MKHSSVDQPGRLLLTDIYALLSNVIAQADTDGTFAANIAAVLETAYLTDVTGPAFPLLPVIACQVLGGSPSQALPCAAAWRAFYLAAKLLDDVQDGDYLRASRSPHEIAQAISLATGLIAIGQIVVQGLAPPLALEVSFALNDAMLTAASAQYAELSGSQAYTLDTYLPILHAKAGKLFAVAARYGGRCAGGTAHIDLLEQFGTAVGILIQLADDLTDFRRSDGQSDLATGTLGLPVLYALGVSSPVASEQLRQMLQAAKHDPHAEADARNLVIAMGGEYYLKIEMERYYQRALQALMDLETQGQTVGPLQNWLTALREPLSL